MTGDQRLIEVQMSTEGSTFNRTQLDKLVDLAEKGVKELIQAQFEAVS